MASSRKRTLIDVLASDEPTLWIQLTDAAAPRLPAHAALLRAYSSCVRGLPAGSGVWDLSGLLIDGAPVERAVVVEWLEAVYTGSCYAEDAEPTPEDAVGSSRHAARACYARCAPRLDAINVTLHGAPFALKLDGTFHEFDCAGALKSCTLSAWRAAAAGGPGGAAAGAAELRPQVAAALEPLLHVAYRLGLRDLQERLHAFLHANVDIDPANRSAYVITVDQLRSTGFSARVMAAVDAAELWDAWLRHVLTVPLKISAPDGLYGQLVAAADGADGSVGWGDDGEDGGGGGGGAQGGGGGGDGGGGAEPGAAGGGGGDGGGGGGGDGGGGGSGDGGGAEPSAAGGGLWFAGAVLQRDYQGTRAGSTGTVTIDVPRGEVVLSFPGSVGECWMPLTLLLGRHSL
ncbi:MAG: hypothetical protein J3K34DRAFT_526351 [Monoraphidium minutum]|nr:MAG: hypothetical protein J3K34DRAFT_526351 [Monoraphidium minutum]